MMARKCPTTSASPSWKEPAFSLTARRGDTSIVWNLSGGGTVSADSVNPIQEGPHSPVNQNSPLGDVEIRNTGRSAYIGGYVYRGPITELQGKYFYSDFVHGNIFSLDFDADTPIENFSGTNFNLQQSESGQNVASLGTREVVLNRNLNSLWHTIMVDTQDPTYTPALGADFGIGRVVSFGEDNAGNLYIIDMGGNRGDPGFGNDYPGGATGQIFRLTAILGMTLTINRDTGEVTLSNTSDAPIDFTGYTISSPSGAIHLSDLVPVSGNYDVPTPPGDGSVDDNDSWTIVSNTETEFSEQSTGDLGTLGASESITLGNAGAWIQSIYEDWSLDVEVPGGATIGGIVQFTGNGDQPFDRSDLDFDGVLDPDDWILFRSNFFNDLSALSQAESYRLGDLDGDGDNDFDDFRLFKDDYVAVHGIQAFEALAQVPEPTSLMLALTVGLVATGIRRREQRGIGGKLTMASRVPRVATAALALLAVAIQASQSSAALQHLYTFNNGVNDSVGNADGQLFGNASVNGLGQLELPGGNGDYLGLNPAEIGISDYTDLTIEAWFTVDNHQTWARLFDYGDRAVADEGYVYYSPFSGFGGNPALARYTTLDNIEFVTHDSPQTGQQHHLAFVIDDNANGGSDQFSVYLNGQLAASTGHNKSLSGIVDTNAYLGRSTALANDPFLDGLIDEFRIYDHALSLGDVQTNFAAGPTPPFGATLRVNTITGEASIVTDSALPVAFDFYEILSPSNALNAATWVSLDDQNLAPSEPGVGEGWEEADLSGTAGLAEFFLLGGVGHGRHRPAGVGPTV